MYPIPTYHTHKSHSTPLHPKTGSKGVAGIKKSLLFNPFPSKEQLLAPSGGRFTLCALNGHKGVGGTGGFFFFRGSYRVWKNAVYLLDRLWIGFITNRLMAFAPGSLWGGYNKSSKKINVGFSKKNYHYFTRA